jgi:hypothetical protein
MSHLSSGGNVGNDIDTRPFVTGNMKWNHHDARAAQRFGDACGRRHVVDDVKEAESHPHVVRRCRSRRHSQGLGDHEKAGPSHMRSIAPPIAGHGACLFFVPFVVFVPFEISIRISP